MLTQSRETLEAAARLLEQTARHLLRMAFKIRYCPDCGERMDREQFTLRCPACGLHLSDSDEPTAEFTETAR